MSKICSNADLQKAKRDEQTAINELKDAILGVHGDVTDSYIDEKRQTVITAMRRRENLVESCVNNIYKQTELQDGQVLAQTTSDQVNEVVEQQRERAVREFDKLLASRNNKKRMMEINTYYSKQYNAYIDIFKRLFMGCIPLLILGILNSNEVIDDTTHFRFSLLVIVITFFTVAWKVNDLYWRNNLVFDTYDWVYDDGSTQSKLDYNRKNFNAKKGLNIIGEDLMGGALSSTCKGIKCCGPDTTWNDSLKKCVVT
tara:strand:+ start:495 stop:1262 length:768 start_codon:yes stop_codon:yes gene_type:complete